MRMNLQKRFILRFAAKKLQYSATISCSSKQDRYLLGNIKKIFTINIRLITVDQIFYNILLTGQSLVCQDLQAQTKLLGK